MGLFKICDSFSLKDEEGLIACCWYLKTKGKIIHILKKKGPMIFNDGKFVRKMMTGFGEHIHMMNLTVREDGVRMIREGLRRLIRATSPSSVSWFNPKGKMTCLQLQP